MHVAAPIRKGDDIIGVLTVAKPNLSVQPFIDIARGKVQVRGIVLVLVSLVIAVTISYWLTSSIRQLVHFSDRIGQGERPAVPELRETELARLAGSIDNMRRKLEGKEYVEKYVHALTHELKSPVSTIKGAAELIGPSMKANDQHRFIGNIQYEIDRIDEMINRLLALVAVERREALEQVEPVDMVDVVNRVSAGKQVLLTNRNLALKTELPSSAVTSGDRFLLTQLIDNILQNAIDFSQESSEITVTVSFNENITLTVRDRGVGIPEYAINKIFDRFYSLARPGSGKKSSGLGLSFVRQIVDLHGGNITVENQPDAGVLVTVVLPGAAASP
jgi:two-component system sensor histidine kinase CreC